MAVLSSCGGGQSGMKLGYDEFTVVAVQSTASQQSTSYPVSYTHLAMAPLVKFILSPVGLVSRK